MARKSRFSAPPTHNLLEISNHNSANKVLRYAKFSNLGDFWGISGGIGEQKRANRHANEKRTTNLRHSFGEEGRSVTREGCDTSQGANNTPAYWCGCTALPVQGW